jgi:hypothetical protein
VDVAGYSDFERDEDGVLTALARYQDGSSRRVAVRVSVEREIRGADGEVKAPMAEVASTDDGSVVV